MAEKIQSLVKLLLILGKRIGGLLQKIVSQKRTEGVERGLQHLVGWAIGHKHRLRAADVAGKFGE